MACPAEPFVLCDEKNSDDNATEGKAWQWAKGGKGSSKGIEKKTAPYKRTGKTDKGQFLENV